MAKKYDFSGYATKYGIKCSDGRTLIHGAFEDMDGEQVPLVWNHDHKEADKVLGHADLEVREDGVYAYCSFNDTDQGKNARELVKHGDISCLSIYANHLKEDNKKNVTHGLIREVSLVLAGANPGARIDNIICHTELADGSTEDVASKTEACIYHDDETIVLENGEEITKQAKTVKDPNANLEHTDPDNKEEDDPEETVADVFNTLTDKQKTVVYAIIGQAISDAENAKGENKEMNHNAFENKENQNLDENKGKELTHAEFMEIIDEAKKDGSVKEAFISHGITNVENLFPEVQAVNKEPMLISRKMGWVAKVMGAVHHTPFSRIKSTAANITGDEARAKGYVKGNQKVEEVIAALKRTTTPVTVYKLQKMDRDDVIDITDFDVLAWLKKEMRMMLDEELARAFLIGDGRSSSSDDKINPLNIRPIYGDSDVYAIAKEVTSANGKRDAAFYKEFIRNVVRARKDYKGSGNPVFYTTEDVLTELLLLEDTNGRVIYDSEAKLATALRVSEIVTVEVMENISRVDGDNTLDLMGIIVNLTDYNVGADRGGAVTMFDDFDINFNKYEYLIETRCSGALVKPYSALVFEYKHATAPVAKSK